jgi:hypothetical protein
MHGQLPPPRRRIAGSSDAAAHLVGAMRCRSLVSSTASLDAYWDAIYIMVMRSSAAEVEPGDMPRPPSNSIQVAIRIPKPWLKEADEIAKLISRPGFEASRTDAIRAAIAKGFEALRAEAAKPAKR